MGDFVIVQVRKDEPLSKESNYCRGVGVGGSTENKSEFRSYLGGEFTELGIFTR